MKENLKKVKKVLNLKEMVKLKLTKIEKEQVKLKEK